MAKGMELAKAYVQIIPSAEGIKGKITEALGGEADSAGKKAGQSIVSKIKGIIAAAGIGTALKAAITEGAALQQSIGGIETLFKDSADAMKKYASDAYKTAGISANSYMEQATSFSASLLSSLGGDTAKAAEAANQAIIDMADNSNKMGTSLDLIQNAYQGFAKQNYTMLDNLKLGYGGTKTEMERLLADATKLSGVKYDIDNLSDVYSAIHVIQDSLGITGTTALEASSTLTGSLAAMKAALSNFLGNLTLGLDIQPSLIALVETTSTFLFANLLPAIANIFTALPGVIGTIIMTYGPVIYTNALTMFNQFLSAIQTQFPKMLSTGAELFGNFITGIMNKLPTLLETAGTMLFQFLYTILGQVPNIIESGGTLLLSLIQGIANNLPQLIVTATGLMIKFGAGIRARLPDILQAGIELLGKLTAGIITAIPNLIGQIPNIIKQIKSKFNEVDYETLGRNIIKGIKNGILNGASAIASAAKTAAKKALNAAKSFLGIHSPSTVFRDQIGKMIDLGLAGGIEGNLKPVTDAMQKLEDSTVGEITPQMYTSSLNTLDVVNVADTTNSDERVLNILATYFPRILEAILSMELVLDDGTIAGRLAPRLNEELEALRLAELRGV